MDLAEVAITVERVGTAIIGGGIAGCAVAYYLAAEGETDILLLEADELGSGSTGGSFGGVRQQFSTPLEIELSRRGLEFWRSAEGVAALVKAAKARGVRFREKWEARSLERAGSGWRVSGPDVIEAERVVACTGYWSSDFLRPFGLELTIRPVPLYAAITAPA